MCYTCEKNPYLDLEYGNGIKGYDAMANTRSYDLSVGFTGTAHATRLAYRAYAGVSFMRDRIYWFVTRPGYFGAHAADDTHFFAGVEVASYRGTEVYGSDPCSALLPEAPGLSQKKNRNQ